MIQRMKNLVETVPATSENHTLSLHDALPISRPGGGRGGAAGAGRAMIPVPGGRSEEHRSELQSRQYRVCRLLLEKKQGGHGACLRLHGGVAAVGVWSCPVGCRGTGVLVD